MKRKFRASETQKSSNASAIDVADPSGCTVVDSNVPNGRRTADASAAASSPGPKRRRKHTSAAQEVDSSVATSPTAVEHSGSTTVSGEPAEEPCANDEPDDATPVGIYSRAMAESSEHLNVVNGGHHQDTTGFTVLEDQRRKGKLKVHRALPAWLAKPSVIKADIHNEKADLGSVVDLCPMLQERLRSNGITHLFPVQQFVIPVVLDTIKHGWYLGRGGYRPSDLCCSAPTGSGKTLAFVLPIVQALQHRVVPRVRALVVLPVRDLAVQVYKVFHSYTEHTSLRVVLIVGQKNLASEQASLVKRSCKAGEYESLADIVVATPGRLVDHIHTTQGFDLSQLRFLVIDEADRMMDEIKQDWLGLVEGAVCRHSDRDLSNTVTAAQESRMQIPLQKLLFSATLSQNPEKLQQLNLFQPKLYTSVPDKASNEKGDGDGEALASRFEGKYTTPTTLAEYFIECTSETKPLVLMYLIMTLKFKRVLCFTNSVETTWRLYNLLDLVGGGIVVQQFSSAEPAYKRSQLVKQFEAGKVNILVCSDAMARGMDVKGVQCVISYDNPAFVKTYIHRVGRTARAGKAGTAISFLEKKQVHHFKEMMKSAGKGKNVTEMKVKKSHLRPLVDTYTTALQRLPSIL